MSARFFAAILYGLIAALVSGAVIIPALATGAEGITTFTGSSSGPIATAINNGNGVAFSGRASNQGIAVQGVIGSGNAGIGVRGVTYGPSSMAVVGQANGTNVSLGSTGVQGYSKSGNGIIGQTFANAEPSPASFAGVLGQDLATPNPVVPVNNVGVEGTSNKGTGVRGISQANLTQPVVDQADAVVGTSNSHRGVHGISISGVGVQGDSTNQAGVSGTSSSHDGVDGLSTSGWGVAGFSTDGLGVRGESVNNIGVFAQSINASALDAFSNNRTAVIAEAGNQSYPALVVQSDCCAPTPSPVVPVLTVKLVTTQSCGGTLTTDIFTISQKGDVAACGTITASTTPLVIRRTTIGQHLVSYAAQQSQPTMEDFGQGQLVSGQAYVPLEPRFAATIDLRANYLVFITPRGDTNGLYVARTTPAGFWVRENRGGRSTIAFDYRIVAKPYDTNAPRLPLANTLPHARSVALPPLIRGRLPLRTVPHK